MANAFQELGASIGQVAGSLLPSGQSEHYADGLQQGYTIQRAMEDAARARNLRLITDNRVASREKLPAALGAVYTDPAQLALAEAVLGSNESINLGNLGKFQNPAAREAFQAAAGLLGDELGTEEVALANRAQDLLAGRTHQPTVIQAGTVRPSGYVLGDEALGGIEVTPQAAAQIASSAGRLAIAQRRAAEGAGGRGGGGGKPAKAPTAAQVDADVLAEARRAVAAGADIAKVRARLVERGYPKVADALYRPPVDDTGL